MNIAMGFVQLVFLFPRILVRLVTDTDPSPKPRPKDLAQLDVIMAVSEDRLDQISQSESDADQDCPCQVVPDPSMFSLIRADLQACCQVTWFWDGDGRACYGLCNVW